jgi:hypothetical protein
MRGRRPALAIALLGLAAAGALVWIGVDAAATPAGNCDNMAGECLRGRQTTTLYLLAVGCFGATVAALWGAWALVRRGWSRGPGTAVGVAAALAALLLLVAPVEHLDDRFGGWLAGPLDAVVASSRRRGAPPSRLAESGPPARSIARRRRGTNVERPRHADRARAATGQSLGRRLQIDYRR